MHRPCSILLGCLALLAVVDGGLVWHHRCQERLFAVADEVRRVTVAGLGLSDLCLATEARYTRHPAVTDLVVPFMDHPGAMDHFPTGSFWAAPVIVR